METTDIVTLVTLFITLVLPLILLTIYAIFRRRKDSKIDDVVGDILVGLGRPLPPDDKTPPDDVA